MDGIICVVTSRLLYLLRILDISFNIITNNTMTIEDVEWRRRCRNIVFDAVSPISSAGIAIIVYITAATNSTMTVYYYILHLLTMYFLHLSMVILQY